MKDLPPKVRYNDDSEYVKKLLAALEKRNGYCPCRLQQISIDFGQEPELLFSLDFPAEKELQLPDFMLLEKITSRTLLVRLVPDKL